jgi:hypothetical protein
MTKSIFATDTLAEWPGASISNSTQHHLVGSTIVLALQNWHRHEILLLNGAIRKEIGLRLAVLARARVCGCRK